MTYIIIDQTEENSIQRTILEAESKDEVIFKFEMNNSESTNYLILTKSECKDLIKSLNNLLAELEVLEVFK